MRATTAKTLLREDIGFLLTNRIPHQVANRLFGWLSQIEVPLLTRVSIAQGAVVRMGQPLMRLPP